VVDIKEGSTVPRKSRSGPRRVDLPSTAGDRRRIPVPDIYG